jgi:DNA-binding transcriptional MocR family regulator
MRYKELAEQCIEQFETGIILINSKMPSLRTFKIQHNVSMTTALNCYQYLQSLGWIVAKPQSGYFVCAPFSTLEKPQLIPFKSITTEPRLGEGRYAPLNQAAGPLGIACMSSRLIPIHKLQLSFRRAMKRQDLRITEYPTVQGEKVLRDSLVSHFKNYDFHLDSQQLVVTNGCLEAINTALEITTKVGDSVAISSPCYSGLLDMLSSMSRKVVEIPCTNQGIDLEQLEKHMQIGEIQAGLFCTSHMNPQGTSMSALQKQQLVVLAETYKIPIIEDDVYLEVAHGKVTPLPAKHWDKAGYVLWCGSVTKTLAAGYRLGWCSPGRYFDTYLKQRILCSQSVSSPTQLAIADFINTGEYKQHLKNFRFQIQQYTFAFQQYLLKNLPENSKISQPSGGFVLWVQVPGLDSNRLFKEASEANIDIRVGSHFTTRKLYQDCIRLNVGYDLTDLNNKSQQQLAIVLQLIKLQIE